MKKTIPYKLVGYKPDEFQPLRMLALLADGAETDEEKHRAKEILGDIHNHIKNHE